jgi:hypothetical protein
MQVQLTAGTPALKDLKLRWEQIRGEIHPSCIGALLGICKRHFIHGL